MHKKSFLPLGLLLMATIISGKLLITSVSYAEVEQADATVTVSSACTMFRESTTPHVASANISSYTENIGATRLKTICNDKDGYAIYAIGYSNNEDGNTNMYGEEFGEIIPTGTINGNVSNWSMKLTKDLESYNPQNLTIATGFENYHEVPAVQTKVVSYTGATDTTEGSVVTTTYAARVSSSQMADTYTGQVKYTMVHPADGTAPEGPEIPKLYIQDVDAASCPKQRTLVYDKRDEEPYYIQEITANGTTLCWMTSNLNLAGGTVLTSTLSNVKPGESYTLPESSINGFYTYDIANVYNSGSTDCSSSQGCKSYYNYTAATLEAHVPAESDSMYDICPAGWRLPRSAEYEDLLADYVSEVGEAGSAPWYTEKSGMLSGGSPSVIAAGSLGFYWSSTTNRSSGGYPNGLFASSTPSMGSQSSFAGGAIRCVAKPILTYMQDINTSEYCSTTPQVVYDKRDDEPYVIQVMEDGNCWMLNNLRLDLGQVSADSLKGNTNATDNSIEYLKGIKTGTSSDRYAMSSVEELADGASYSNPRFTKSDISEQYSWGTESYGAYYNFCAASAGSYCYGDGESYGSPEGEVSEDICPKGWRLPTGGLNGEFYELYTKYPDSTSFYTAFKASFPGSSQVGYIFSTGSTLNLWSSTPVNGQFEYFLYAHSIAGTISAQESSERTKGFSIRCIAKEPEPEKTYIQDITLETCPTTRTLVYDVRDEKGYYIQKITTGDYTLCWMTSDLDLAGETPLYSDTSNVPDGYPSSGGVAYYTLPASVEYDSSLEIRNGDEYVYNTGNTECDDDQLCYSYYTYATAVAGNNPMQANANAPYDICPKGWRLPIKEEFSALMSVYPDVPALTSAPWYGSKHGYLYIGENYVGEGSSYWSSSNRTTGYSWAFSMTYNNSFSSVNDGPKMGAMPVRCIAKLPTMQETTSQDLESMIPNTGDLTILTDARDGRDYRVTNVNGTFWMTQNLDLAGQTPLYSDTSNVPAGYPSSIGLPYYTLPNSTQAGFYDENEAYLYNSKKTECADDTPCYSYYSYKAATAGLNPSSGDAEYDICPKNWKLPTNNDYTSLANSYSTSAAIIGTPWQGVYSGDYWDDYYFVGGYGEYWSSTADNASEAYALSYYKNYSGTIYDLVSVYPDMKYYGYAVRCIAKNDSEPEPEVPHDIQDVSVDVCPTTPTTVYDSRDGHAYQIAKLEDGNCWMLDNLNLGRSTVKVLTPDDTNIEENFTLPGSISTGFSSYVLPQINIDSRNDTASYGDGENKIGVYYNYCAATAGTYCDANGEADGDSYYDICPKGWRLPTGSESGEYQALVSEYNTAADFKNALRAALSGYFKYSSTNHQGSTGSAWTSTGNGVDGIYSLDVRKTKILQDYNSERNAGISIRCIAKNGTEPTPPVKVYSMQKVSTWKNKLSVNETVKAIDDRDGKEYLVTKVYTDPNIPDGRADCTGTGSSRTCTQVWMTQNLDLDLSTSKTLTHANTDLGWSNNDANVVLTPVMSTTSNASDLTLTDEEERSFNPGNDVYYFTSNNSEKDYSYSLDQCTSAGNTEEECKHYHAGNFYNYYAAAALGATSNGNPVTVGTNQYSIMPNSICPAGWRLPTGYTAADSYNDFDYLLAQNNVLETYANQMGRNPGYTTSANGFYNIRTEPIWLTRAGYIYNGTYSAFTSNGNYHLNTVKDAENNHMFNFGSTYVYSDINMHRWFAHSVRCLAR